VEVIADSELIRFWQPIKQISITCPTKTPRRLEGDDRFHDISYQWDPDGNREQKATRAFKTAAVGPPVIPTQPALLDMLSCGDRMAN